MDSNTETHQSIYWINLERFEDAKCLHFIAMADEAREFKGVKVLVATPVLEAAPALHHALQVVATAMNRYTAPLDIVRVVSDALEAAKGNVAPDPSDADDTSDV